MKTMRTRGLAALLVTAIIIATSACDPDASTPATDTNGDPVGCDNIQPQVNKCIDILFVLSNDYLVQYHSQQLIASIETLIDEVWAAGYTEVRVSSTTSHISTTKKGSLITDEGDGGSLLVHTQQGSLYPTGAGYGEWVACISEGASPSAGCGLSSSYTCPDNLLPVCKSGFGPNFCIYHCGEDSDCQSEFNVTFDTACTGVSEPYSCEVTNTTDCPETMSGFTELTKGNVDGSLLNEIKCRLNIEKSYGVRMSTQQTLKSLARAVVQDGPPTESFPSKDNDLLIVIVSARDDCTVRQDRFIPQAADEVCRLTGSAGDDPELIPAHVIQLLSPEGASNVDSIPEENSFPLIPPEIVAQSLLQSIIADGRKFFVLGIIGLPNTCFSGENEAAEAFGFDPICIPGEALQPDEVEQYITRIENMASEDDAFCGKTGIACVRHHYVPQLCSRLSRFVEGLGTRGRVTSICNESWFDGVAEWVDSVTIEGR